VDADDVRRQVARLAGASEGAHHGHPDFRVGGKIFATLDQAERCSAVRLTADEARAVSAQDPLTFRLVSDREPVAWVSVLLERISPEPFADLLEQA
jgi:hypothetical protein